MRKKVPASIFTSLVALYLQDIFLPECFADDSHCEECPSQYECGKAKRAFCTYDHPAHDHTKMNGKNDRIKQGGPALYAEWPWVVAIVLKSEKNVPICSATLLSNKWAVSIFGCVDGRNKNEFELQFGQHSTVKEDEPLKVVTRDIVRMQKQFVTPTKYDRNLVMIGFNNVPYSFHINRICLPGSAGGGDSDGSYAMIAGWGRFDDSGTRKSDKLREIKVRITNYDNCKRLIENLGKPGIAKNINDQHLCSLETSKNPICKGDVGGPMMRFNSNRRWTLWAILSDICTCEGDAPVTLPGTYFRSKKALSYIQDTLNTTP